MQHDTLAAAQGSGGSMVLSTTASLVAGKAESRLHTAPVALVLLSKCSCIGTPRLEPLVLRACAVAASPKCMLWNSPRSTACISGMSLVSDMSMAEVTDAATMTQAAANQAVENMVA